MGKHHYESSEGCSFDANNGTKAIPKPARLLSELSSSKVLSTSINELSLEEQLSLLQFHNEYSIAYYFYQLSLKFSGDPFFEANEKHRDASMMFIHQQEMGFELFHLIHAIEIIANNPALTIKLKQIIQNNLDKHASQEMFKSSQASADFLCSCEEVVNDPQLSTDQRASITEKLRDIQFILDKIKSEKTPKDPIIHLAPEDFLKKLQKDANKPSMMLYANGLEILCPDNLADDIETYVVLGHDGAIHPELKACNPHFSGTKGRGKIAYLFYGATGETPHCEHVRKSFMGTAIYDPTENSLGFAFRGSRSGALRAGQSLKGEGNADWATDLSFEGVHEPRICPEGQVCYGFSKAYLSVEKSLASIFVDAQEQSLKQTDSNVFPGMLKITVTGHSLGGALATLFLLAMKVGKFKEALEVAINQRLATLELSFVQTKDRQLRLIFANQRDFWLEERTTQQLKAACRESTAVTFSAPPTSDKQQVNYLQEIAKISPDLKRVYVPEDVITFQASNLLINFLSRFKPKTKQGTKGRGTRIYPRHVTADQVINLGNVLNTRKPATIVFMQTRGLPHAPYTNEQKIVQAIDLHDPERKLPRNLTFTCQYPTLDLKKFSALGHKKRTPSVYANLVVHGKDFELDLNSILGKRCTQLTAWQKEPWQKRKAFLSDLDAMISVIENIEPVDRSPPNTPKKRVTIRPMVVENDKLGTLASRSPLMSGDLSLVAHRKKELIGVERLISSLIDFEITLKNSIDRDIFQKRLTALFQFSKTLGLMAKKYPNVASLEELNTHTRILAGLYRTMAYPLIRYEMKITHFPKDAKKYFAYYDKLIELNEKGIFTGLLQQYELLLERYVAERLKAENPLETFSTEDITPMPSLPAFEILSIECALEAFSAAVTDIEKNPLISKIQQIITNFETKATRWNGMQEKAVRISEALNQLSVTELKALTYEELISNQRYQILKEALNSRRYRFGCYFMSHKTAEPTSANTDYFVSASMLFLAAFKKQQTDTAKPTMLKSSVFKSGKEMEDSCYFKLVHFLKLLFRFFLFKKCEKTKESQPIIKTR